MKKRVLVDMSCSILHHGHVEILKKASKLGKVVVALTTDQEIKKKKGYFPELNFNFRSKIIKSIKYVDEVVPSKWNISDGFIRKKKIDILVHGQDEKNSAKCVKKKIFKRTKGISSTQLRYKSYKIYKNLNE